MATTPPQAKKGIWQEFKEFLNQVVEPGKVVSKDVEDNINHWIGEIDGAVIIGVEHFQRAALRPCGCGADQNDGKGGQ